MGASSSSRGEAVGSGVGVRGGDPLAPSIISTGDADLLGSSGESEDLLGTTGESTDLFCWSGEPADPQSSELSDFSVLRSSAKDFFSSPLTSKMSSSLSATSSSSPALSLMSKMSSSLSSTPTCSSSSSVSELSEAGTFFGLNSGSPLCVNPWPFPSSSAPALSSSSSVSECLGPWCPLSSSESVSSSVL